MIKVKKLDNRAKIPYKALDGDAGYDVFSVTQEVIPPRTRKKFPLGIAVEIPEGYMLMVADKSSMINKRFFFTVLRRMVS